MFKHRYLYFIMSFKWKKLSIFIEWKEKNHDESWCIFFVSFKEQLYQILLWLVSIENVQFSKISQVIFFFLSSLVVDNRDCLSYLFFLCDAKGWIQGLMHSKHSSWGVTLPVFSLFYALDCEKETFMY